MSELSNMYFRLYRLLIFYFKKPFCFLTLLVWQHEEIRPVENAALKIPKSTVFDEE